MGTTLSKSKMENEIVSYKLKLPAQSKTCRRKATDRIPHTDMLMGRLIANKNNYVEKLRETGTAIWIKFNKFHQSQVVRNVLEAIKKVKYSYPRNRPWRPIGL
jgi:ABC-type histidine transport system ATPase subunit